MGKKRIHNRPKIPQIQAVYCLTGAFEAPIYRAHAARWPLVLRAVFRLWQNEGSPLAGLFDIVIRGRGTWAAARSHAREQSRAINRAFRTLAFFSKERHETDRVFRSARAGIAINSVMSGICEQRRAFVCSSIKHESLILAQNERWRQASNMQV